MGTPHDIPLRSARDRIIDLLEIGDSYPLTDLNVVADQLKVAFGGTAKIPIEDAQAGVSYQLCDPKGQSLGDEFEAEGNDATLVIETPKVMEDVTYRIRATKRPSASALPAQDPRFLDEGAPVKVGIDTGLVIRFEEKQNLPLLDPANLEPKPADPRIVPYGTSVNVEVENSQEGVEYLLMLDGRDTKTVVTGTLHDIVLATGPMLEDVVIQVQATKNFLASENRASETKPLDEKLYLKVMANPAPAVSVDPLPIVDYRQDAAIKVADTQASAKYQAYVRAIADADFVRGAAADGEVAKVPVDGKPDVQVKRPAQSGVWVLPDGYLPLGDVPAAGTGGDLKLTVKALAEDTLVIVQALKEHQVDPDTRTIASSIGLDQAAVILVRPDPAQALRLRVQVAGTQTGDTMQVSGGQPGVFYYFQPAPNGPEFPRPAYFHKRDAEVNAQNKGVNQLAVEVDFVIADDPDAAARVAADPATTPPRLPTIGIAPVATGSMLHVRALKAQTAVETKMAEDARIAAVPAIRADPPVVDYCDSAHIVIPASNPQESYQAMLQGAPVKPTVAGDTSDLTVITDPMTADEVFEVLATPSVAAGIQVERFVQLSVPVRPDAGLPVSAKLDVVAKDAGTGIVVQGSQKGVNYQLMSGQTAIGAAVPGTAADIMLPTGPISADTTFTVTAIRADNAAITAVLEAQASVSVAPDTALPISAKLDLVIKDTGTDIVVQGSQKGINYQLMSGQSAIGAAVPGTGADIVLPTGPISADTTFTVSATRADNAKITAVLKAQAAVKLKPGA